MNCCDKTQWTADCFLDEHEVLVHQFCSKPSSDAHLTCCQETGKPRLLCLNETSSKEAQDIPNEILLTSKRLCKVNESHRGGLVVWFTFEYTRRHREESLNAVLDYVPEFENIVQQCCEEITVSTCLSKNLAPLRFHFPTPS
ncbi:albumin-like [Discoglossus pictus]